MAAEGDGPSALPTLGWVESGAFHALPTVFLQSLMDVPVRSWDDFSCADRKRLRNLKCMLPSGEVVPGLVPIVKEFDPNWPREWTALVWADGHHSLRLEHMVETNGIVQAFDIDPTPAPNYTPPTTNSISANVTDVRYGGWTDETHMFVLPRGVAAALFDINYTSLEELNGVTYDIHARTTRSVLDFPQGVGNVVTEEVRVFVWNCRGIARASFRPNLFTILSLTRCGVVVLTETRAAGRNARQILETAHGLEYFYVEPMGFVGGVAVLWETSKVMVAGVRGEDNYVSFAVKGFP